MELYQKKRYLQNQGNKGLKIKYNKGYNPLNKEENIYLQKMLEQNKLNKLPNENITNIITNMENILSNENNFKRAMKYVSSYNKNYQNDKFFYRNTEKSASPLGRRTQYKNLYENTTPFRKVLNITRQPLIEKYNNTKNIDVGNDVYFTKINNKNKNNDECYDIEISSINDNKKSEIKNNKSEKANNSQKNIDIPTQKEKNEEKNNNNKNNELVPIELIPKLTKEGYKCIPSTLELSRMTKEELKKVEGFKIYNQYGEVEFKEPVNLLGLDLDKLVDIEKNMIDTGDELDYCSKFKLYNFKVEENGLNKYKISLEKAGGNFLGYKNNEMIWEYKKKIIYLI